jgi:hypothetical protein
MASSSPGQPVMTLRDIALALRHSVEITRHTGGLFGLQRFEETFTGAGAIGSLVRGGFARTRPEAARLGNSMIEAGFMRHVKDSRQPLKDKPTSLYRWGGGWGVGGGCLWEAGAKGGPSS